MRSPIVFFLILIVAAGPGLVSARSSQEPLSGFGSEWKNEALFDSTTTRGELLDMGRSAVNLKHFPLAEIYFQEVLLREPGNVEAMWELARLYNRTGRLEYARGLLVRAKRAAPYRTDVADLLYLVEKNLRVALHQEIESLMKNGQFEQGLPRLGVLLSITPDDPDVLAMRARCLSNLGQKEAALAAVDLALKKSPRTDLHELRTQIAESIETARVTDLEESARRLIVSGNWVREEALDVLQSILARDPANEWAREQFRVLNETGHPAEEPKIQLSIGQQLAKAMKDTAPGIARFVDRHFGMMMLVVVIVVLFRSPLSRAFARRVDDPSPFAGDLGRIDVVEVLHLANVSALTGTLVLRTPEGRARVFLEDGEPLHCVALNRYSGTEALLWIVAHVEEGTFELRAPRGRIERTIDQPLGLLLAGQTSATVAAQKQRAQRKSRISELLETHTD